MKHLKIYFAVLFFIFLGSIYNQVSAQPEATKGIYKLTYSLALNEFLEHDAFIAALRYNETDPNLIELWVLDRTSNTIVKRISLCKMPPNKQFKKLYFKGTENLQYLCYETKDGFAEIGGLSIEDRNVFASQGHKVLDKTAKVRPNTYLELTSDGRILIHSGSETGIPSTPIVELMGK
jgi:hypothetical protein